MRIKILIAAALLISISILLSGCVSSNGPTTETKKINNEIKTATFIIQPKIGMVTLDDKNPRASATEDMGKDPLVLLEGKSFVIDLSNSIVPNPPASYFYDDNGDGIAERPFTNGTWEVFTMRRSDPLPSVCREIENGETCTSKISGIDSAGNKAEFIFTSTTIYK